MHAHALAAVGGVGGVGGEWLQVELHQLVHGLAVRLVRARARARVRARSRGRVRGGAGVRPCGAPCHHPGADGEIHGR